MLFRKVIYIYILCRVGHRSLLVPSLDYRVFNWAWMISSKTLDLLQLFPLFYISSTPLPFSVEHAFIVLTCTC